MQGSLWLLVQTVPLIAAAAAVFLWLGRRWRVQDAALAAAGAVIPTMASKESQGAASHEAAARVASLAGELRIAGQRSRQLEEELQSLRDMLAAAQAESAKVSADAAQSAARMQSEMTRTLREREQLEREVAALKASATTKEPLAKTTEPPGPAPRTTPRPGRPAKRVDPAPRTRAEVLERLLTSITANEHLLQTLTRERGEWRRQVQGLEEGAAANPSALALARKSLERSEQQLQEVGTGLIRERMQAEVLQNLAEIIIPDAAHDDLTQIKGIKTKLCHQLHAFGIHTYRQIALWSDTEMEAFSALLHFKTRAKRDRWQQQARSLHLAKYGVEP